MQSCYLFYILTCISTASVQGINTGININADTEIAYNISVAIYEILKISFVGVQQQRVYNLFSQATQKKRLTFFGEITNNLASVENIEISARIGMGTGLIKDNERHYSVLLVDSIQSFSAYPYNDYHCQGFAPTIQNKFVNLHWQHQQFYPDKLANFHGCPLKCATWENMPFFAVKRNRDNEVLYMIGFEGKLLEYIATKMNFSVQFYWMNEEEIKQTVDDENTIFDKLFSTGTDFVFGAFQYKATQTTDSHSPTTPYYLSRFYFIVNSDLEHYGPLLKLTLPFMNEIWYLLAITYICGFIFTGALYFIDKSKRYFIVGYKNKTPLYNMFIASLGGTIITPPNRNFARFILFLWIMKTMVLRIAYQAFLYHFIKSDLHLLPPQTILELYQQKYDVFVTDVVYDLLDDLPLLRTITHVSNATNLYNFDLIKNNTSKVSILTALEYFGYYRRENVYNTDFYVIPDKLFTQQLSIYMRKNSMILSQFNQLIALYASVGLMDKWERELIETRTSSVINIGDKLPQVMTLKQLYGAVLLLLFGYCLSLLVFLIEILFWSTQKMFKKLKCSRKRKYPKKCHTNRNFYN
ncbi:uncharacterized protein LOC119667544 [Teleopsis dalmanni]|uniref:uncharacterized protein LOC119667544 n=1 Tax=Teleopsis dalmanni TaxID=139649 RepID=UPI0018CEF3FC|nr:uncharacterized protein LOC119667544 [Teleopsis dalmanni]